MKPNEIKAELMRKNVRQMDIAKSLKIGISTVNDVISGRGKSARVERAVSQIIGKPVDEIFPKSA